MFYNVLTGSSDSWVACLKQQEVQLCLESQIKQYMIVLFNLLKRPIAYLTFVFKCYKHNARNTYYQHTGTQQRTRALQQKVGKLVQCGNFIYNAFTVFILIQESRAKTQATDRSCIKTGPRKSHLLEILNKIGHTVLIKNYGCANQGMCGKQDEYITQVNSIM